MTVRVRPPCVYCGRKVRAWVDKDVQVTCFEHRDLPRHDPACQPYWRALRWPKG